MTEKRCPVCGDVKPRTLEHWHRLTAARDGLQYRCRLCMNRPGHVGLRKLKTMRELYR